MSATAHSAGHVGVAGQQVAWGVNPEWLSASICNLGTGSRVARRRLRRGRAAVAFVRHQDGSLTQHHLALAAGGTLRLLPACAANRKEACNVA